MNFGPSQHRILHGNLFAQGQCVLIRSIYHPPGLNRRAARVYLSLCENILCVHRKLILYSTVHNPVTVFSVR